MEPLVEEGKADRLARDEHIRYLARADVLDTEYRKYWIQIPPRNLPFYPKEDEVSDIPCVAQFLNQEHGINDDFKKLVARTFKDSIVPAINKWIVENKADRLSAFPKSLMLSPCRTFDLPSELKLAKNFLVTDIESPEATSLYGHEIFAWRDQDSETAKPDFDSYARDIMIWMLESLNLDPETTTTGDLDELDPFFVCVNCGNRRANEAHARSWRTHVSESVPLSPSRSRYDLMLTQRVLVR